MTLYKLYKYTTQNIVEVEYLLNQAERFNLLDKVQEAFFQFSPRLVEVKIEGFGEHEPWANSHINLIVNELTYYLVDQVLRNEYDREYWYNEQIDNEAFTPFLLKTDFRELDTEIIYEKFKDFLYSIDKEEK